MAKNIGRLNVILTASTAKFNSAMAAAAKPVQMFGGVIGSVVSRITSFQSILAGSVLGGGMTYLIKRSLDSVDALGKTSRQLGLTTEALAGLRHAADLGGASATDLDTALRYMNRNLAEASAGTGEAVDAFGALGLDVGKLLALKPEQALGEIADAMRRLQSPADRVGVAMDIFGRSGAKMITVLEGGSEGLRAMQADAERLGITFSAIDAKGVEDANDAFERVKKAIGGVADKIAINLAPYIKHVADLITDKLANVNWTEKILNGIDFVITGFARLANIVQGTIRVISGAFYTFASLLDKMPDLPGSGIGSMRAILHEGANKLEDFTSGSNWEADIVKARDEILKMVEKGKNAGGFKNPIPELDTESALAKYKAAQAAEKERQTAFAKMQSDADALAKSLRKPSEVFAEQLDKLDDYYNKGVLSYENYKRGLEKVSADLEKSLAKSADKIKDYIYAPSEALVRGSSAEIGFRARAYASSFRPSESPVAIAKAELQEAEKTNLLLTQIREELKNIQPISVN